jgi:hypothetical protein
MADGMLPFALVLAALVGTFVYLAWPAATANSDLIVGTVLVAVCAVVAGLVVVAVSASPRVGFPATPTATEEARIAPVLPGHRRARR